MWSILAERFLTIDDLGNLPPPKWLIEGLFEQDALVMLVGPPGSFKSFLAIDWALCLASGRKWNGRATAGSRVLYCLGEGKASLLKRINAWVEHHQLDKHERDTLNANFRVTFQVPQLADRRNTQEFSSDLMEDGFNPTVLIIDTLARSFVGKDENSQLDVGLWIDSADHFRQNGVTVLVLHHVMKNTEFGLRYRGSTAWEGALDTGFVIQRNAEGFKGMTKLSSMKQKDHEDPEDIWMRHAQIRPVSGGEGSIVLVETDKPVDQDDEERAAEDAALKTIIDNLMADPTYESDRARARALMEKTGLVESAAQGRIHRARKKGYGS